MLASFPLENRGISWKVEVHRCARGGGADLQRAVPHALVPRDALCRAAGRTQLPGENPRERSDVCMSAVESNVLSAAPQDDRGAVMECDGQLQGVQWYTFGCTNAPDPSTYSKICQYTRWMKDVMRNNSPTSPPTLTTPPPTVKEGADAEGLRPEQGGL